MRSLNYRKQIWMSFQLPLKHRNRNWTSGFRKVVPKSWSCNQRALSQYVFRIDFRSSNSSCEPELSLWFLNISAGKSAEKQQQQQPRPKGFLYCFKRKKVQTTLEIRVLKRLIALTRKCFWSSTLDGRLYYHVARHLEDFTCGASSPSRPLTSECIGDLSFSCVTH